MTVPHPRAVGSYGDEFAEWSQRRSGRSLRWWQRLAAARILEHDDEGNLVWLWVLLSTSRQVGKSVLLGELALWRLHQASRWGEPQLVLMTSKDIPAAREVHRSARVWARGQPHWTVREANGQEEVASPDGSRWAVRGSGSVYSYAASLALVDEAWGVDTGVVDDGIEPTTVERSSPQILLVSTAHRHATRLFPRRRTQALANLNGPDEVLLIEWSAPAGLESGDAAGWRAASPHWSHRRERMVAAKHHAAVSGFGTADAVDQDPLDSFRSQWLNVWPIQSTAEHGRAEPLLEAGAWESLVNVRVGGPAATNVLAVEDNYGRGAAVAIAATNGDGRVQVWGNLYQSRVEALTAIGQYARDRPNSRLLIGASLAGDQAIPTALVTSVETASTAHTKTGLPLLRELVTQRRLTHDGGAELTAQVGGLFVTEGAGGLGVSTRSGRSDLVRAAAWAVAAALGAEDGLPFFVY